MTRPRCLILGGGGHARVVLDVLATTGAAVPVGILDADSHRWGSELDGVPILGGDDQLPRLAREPRVSFIVGLGATGDNRPRARLFSLGLEHGLTPLAIRHASAVCSPRATIGRGSVCCAGSIVGPGAAIGENVIVNTGAIVEHDVVIGDHAHIATGARLAGAVCVDALAHVGAGATVKQGVHIGEGAVIGAGCVVIRDVAPWTTVVGVPARELRREAEVEASTSRSRPTRMRT